jgi:hypothetical protein
MESLKNTSPLQGTRTDKAFPRKNDMVLFKRHLPKIFLAAAALMLFGGLLAGEHNMFFTYAIVICLNCIGIG